METEATPFRELAAKYLSHRESLRWQIRSEVTQQNLLRHLEAAEPGTALDVGGGDGVDSIWLASLGYQVDLLEPEARMRQHAESKLSEFAIGHKIQVIDGTINSFQPDKQYDLVLCHGVLMYVDDPINESIGRLMSFLNDAGKLSLLTKNRLSLASRPAFAGDFEEAEKLFDQDKSVGNLGAETRAHSLQEVSDALFEANSQLLAWYGVRVFVDHLSDSESNHLDLDAVLRTELKASISDPYRGIGRLLHVVARRGFDFSSLTED